MHLTPKPKFIVKTPPLAVLTLRLPVARASPGKLCANRGSGLASDLRPGSSGPHQDPPAQSLALLRILALNPGFSLSFYNRQQ